MDKIILPTVYWCKHKILDVFFIELFKVLGSVVIVKWNGDSVFFLLNQFMNYFKSESI